MKINFIKFIFIFSLIIDVINGQVIIPMKKDLNSYYIKIFCNKEKTKYEYMKINMAIDFTFVPISEQMIDYKIHSENEIIEIDNKEYNTKLISCNNFYLENNNNYNLDLFNFYSINKTEITQSKIDIDNTKYTNLYKGQFGLSPIYENDNLNMLYILKQNKLINSLSFGFAFNEIKNNDDDFSFFGEIEEKNKNEILKTKKIITKFDLNKKLLKKYNKWGFKLDALVIEKTSGLIKNIKHKYFAYFNLIEDRIFVPDKIMEYIISRVFNIYIKNKICFVTEYSDKKFINCYKKKLIKEKKNFPNIIFVVNNYSFKLTYDDLFINSVNDNEIIFIIQKNYYDIDTSIILFGSRFIKKYITEFDLENYKIIFHSDNILPKINLELIEDDSWKDMIRDYNKEIEHYDSNYGNDKESENDNDENDEDNDNINNEDKNEKENIDNNVNNKTRNDIENKNNIIKENSDYGIFIKTFFAIIIIIFIFLGIYVFFKERKKIRINSEKDYFKQPFNNNKNED